MTRRNTKRILHLLLILVLISITWYSSQHQQTVAKVVPPAGSYKVVQFDDGDTIAVDMDGTQETVRFIGVDTPETHDPRKAVQCYGHEASDFTKNLIGDQPVRLVADPTNTNRDRYNRLLRYLYLPDGRLVNEEIIKAGYGFAYLGFPFEKSDQFATDQKVAKKQRLGLWASCKPYKNQYGGYSSNDL